MHHIFSLILGITGVILIAQPTVFFPNKPIKPGNYDYVRGVCFSLCGSFVNSGAFLVLRKLKNIKATYSVYSYAIGCILVPIYFHNNTRQTMCVPHIRCTCG